MGARCFFSPFCAFRQLQAKEFARAIRTRCDDAMTDFRGVFTSLFGSFFFYIEHCTVIDIFVHIIDVKYRCVIRTRAK